MSCFSQMSQLLVMCLSVLLRFVFQIVTSLLKIWQPFQNALILNLSVMTMAIVLEPVILYRHLFHIELFLWHAGFSSLMKQWPLTVFLGLFFTIPEESWKFILLFWMLFCPCSFFLSSVFLYFCRCLFCSQLFVALYFSKSCFFTLILVEEWDRKLTQDLVPNLSSGL